MAGIKYRYTEIIYLTDGVIWLFGSYRGISINLGMFYYHSKHLVVALSKGKKMFLITHHSTPRPSSQCHLRTASYYAARRQTSVGMFVAKPPLNLEGHATTIQL